MAQPTELLSGTCRQFLFSPKGGVEGLLLTVKGKTVQVSMTPPEGAALHGLTEVGKRLRLLASPDHSPKTADKAHPVYQLQARANAAGQALDWPETETQGVTLRGTVAAMHFARHGQPNGVVLESGDFIHLRPHGMVTTGLQVGSKVRAMGDVRTTVLGTRLLEAHRVNGIELG